MAEQAGWGLLDQERASGGTGGGGIRDASELKTCIREKRADTARTLHVKQLERIEQVMRKKKAFMRAAIIA